MSYINVVLDAEDEVTPSFTSGDVSGDPTRSAIVPIQVSRTGSTVADIDLALDACVLNEDGTLHQVHNGTKLVDAWHQIDGSILDLTSTRDTHWTSRTPRPGTAYRLRYNTNATTPVRVVVPTPFRPTTGRSF